MTVTIDGATGITTPGITDLSGNDALYNITGNTLGIGVSSVSSGYQSEIKAASGIGAALLLTASDTNGNAQAVVRGARQFQIGTGNASSSYANIFYIFDSTAAVNRLALDSGGIFTSYVTPTTDIDSGSLMLVRSTAITLTTQTAPAFSSIPSWVSRITLSLANMSCSGTSNPKIQLGTSGGFVTTGYLGSVNLTTNNTANSVGFLMTYNNAAANIYHGSYVLNRIGSSTWACTGMISRSSDDYITFQAGSVTLGAALTDVRLYIDGTQFFDAGTVNIQYE